MRVTNASNSYLCSYWRGSVFPVGGSVIFRFLGFVFLMSLLMYFLYANNTQAWGFPLFARVSIGLGVSYCLAAGH